MLTVSTSKIKDFHDYTKGMPWINEEALIMSIMGIKKEAFQLDFGNLVDAMVNDQLTGDKKEYEKITQKLDMSIHPDGILEIKNWVHKFKHKHPNYLVQATHKKIYTTKYGDLAVTIKTDIDVPDENFVVDVKTSKHDMKYDTHGSSLQGYIYLDALERDHLLYECFKVYHTTLKVKYSGAIKQNPASNGFLAAIFNQFMYFVTKNGLLPYIDRPDVYTMDTVLFAPKHFYKKVSQVAVVDPGYLAWMASAGYKFDDETTFIINQFKQKKHGKS